VVQRWTAGWMIGGSIPGRGWEFFSSPRSNLLWDPPSLQSNGTRNCFLGVKRPGREADHSPPSSAEVMNSWSYPFPPYAFIPFTVVSRHLPGMKHKSRSLSRGSNHVHFDEGTGALSICDLSVLTIYMVPPNDDTFGLHAMHICFMVSVMLCAS
jgi:hypothetical protein